MLKYPKYAQICKIKFDQYLFFVLTFKFVSYIATFFFKLTKKNMQVHKNPGLK